MARLLSISTDDGATWTNVTAVRVSIVQVKDTDYPENRHALFNFNDEGLIEDVWLEDEVIGTSATLWEDILYPWED
jgi:hypothetical protein